MDFSETMVQRARDPSGDLVLPEGSDDRVREVAGPLVEEGIAETVLLLDSGGPVEAKGVEAVDPLNARWASDVESHPSDFLDEESDVQKRSRIPSFTVRLSLKDVAQRKAPDSPLEGDANVLVPGPGRRQP